MVLGIWNLNMIRARNNILYLLVSPVLTGILLGVSAIPSKVWFLGFIAFIPLLVASDWTIARKRSFVLFTLQLFIALVIFYFYVYLWVLQTANLGFILGFLIVLPYLIFISPYILLKKRGSRYSSVYFIAAWLTSELAQSYYQLGSPFFTLGNNLGASPKLIQWYEITGAAGGTLWILVVNFVLFYLAKAIIDNSKRMRVLSLQALGILLLPMAISFIMFHTYREKGETCEVLIIHPSTDNKDVKYRVNIYELMDIYLDIMLPQLTENTEYVVLPETAITNAGWVEDLNNNLVIDHFRERTKEYPNFKLVTGAILYEEIPNVRQIKGYERIPGIRYSEKYEKWYYTYNAALHIENKPPVQMRVKEGLVPYQEFAPYPRLMPRLTPVGIDFQFSKRKPNQSVFSDRDNKKTAAFICYELVYGNKFTRVSRKGAKAFFVLLNEGWYDNPKVPKQFIQLTVIRAIENRRDVAHSSNMGISAFINQKGELIAKNESRAPGFLKHTINTNHKSTIYSTLGNYLGNLGLVTNLVMILINILRKRSSQF